MFNNFHKHCRYFSQKFWLQSCIIEEMTA